jgi:acyl-CoA hydrolase
MSAEDVTVAKPPTIGAALANKRRSPEAVVEHITEGNDLIAGMANSEPATVLDAIEAQAERLSGVRIHQMLPFRERRYMHGQSFIVLHSTTADESVSRIVAHLHPGAAVTTFKNIVDRVVTEYGVAELRGSSIRERTRKLIGIAHPKFRDELQREAREMGYL